MNKCSERLQMLVRQMKGGGSAPPRAAPGDILWAGIGGMIAISLIAMLSLGAGIPALMAPLGASCFLAFVAPESPFAQPRNIIGGHLVSTFVGLLVLATLGAEWWAMGLAVGLAIMAMQLTRSGHPPAGADPLVVLVSHPDWLFLVTPVLLGAVIVAGTALLFNNLRPGTHYPKYWRG
jgi:CBS-domain-containing membrane protein